nr:hypothetical protein [Tanacetum cinerariifolium]
YPNVQENLKLAVEEPVLLEEPDSSSGTLSSLQHLSRDFSFRDQFFSDKHSDADKNAETKVESMVNVTIQQALSSISLMTSPIIDLTSRPDHGSRLHILKQLDIPQRVSIDVSEVVTDAVDWAMQASLRNRFRDLPKADMKEILHQRMNSCKTWLKHVRIRKRVASHQKCHLGHHLISHLLLLHQRVHSELRGLLELLDQPKCHHHHLHLHPPVKKIRPKALLHQVHQRQLHQLNIKPGR